MSIKKMLTCPICGKSYGYESKICRSCEDYAIRSSLTKKNPSINNLFLFTSISRFGKVEHHSLRIMTPLDHEWNCTSPSKIRINQDEKVPRESIDVLRHPLEKHANFALFFE